MKTQILNSKGAPVILNAQEQRSADYMQQHILNATGYEVDITTLTAISKRVIEQKFFKLDLFNYVPIRVGEGAWSSNILTYRTFAVGDGFETGIINTAAGNSKFANTDTAVDSITVPVFNWGKEINWTIFDLAQATRSGNWDLVSSKEKARKMNWDLGIQEIAFLGARSASQVKGLLTQSDVTANTALITEAISTMDVTEFTTFVQGVVQAYRANANYTTYPTHFIIPESDYNGLAAPYSPTYPNISKMQYLLDAFKMITQNPNFKILPVAYANKAQNATVSGLNKNRYTLLNWDEDTIRMDIPVDYTSTTANTLNGVQFQNVGYGQFTGVKAYRPAEVLYFDWG